MMIRRILSGRGESVLGAGYAILFNTHLLFLSPLPVDYYFDLAVLMLSL